MKKTLFWPSAIVFFLIIFLTFLGCGGGTSSGNGQPAPASPAPVKPAPAGNNASLRGIAFTSAGARVGNGPFQVNLINTDMTVGAVICTGTTGSDGSFAASFHLDARTSVRISVNTPAGQVGWTQLQMGPGENITFNITCY